jgi:hypothetical protein
MEYQLTFMELHGAITQKIVTRVPMCSLGYQAIDEPQNLRISARNLSKLSSIVLFFKFFSSSNILLSPFSCVSPLLALLSISLHHVVCFLSTELPEVPKVPEVLGRAQKLRSCYFCLGINVGCGLM